MKLVEVAWCISSSIECLVISVAFWTLKNLICNFSDVKNPSPVIKQITKLGSFLHYSKKFLLISSLQELFNTISCTDFSFENFCVKSEELFFSHYDLEPTILKNHDSWRWRFSDTLYISIWVSYSISVVFRSLTKVSLCSNLE